MEQSRGISVTTSVMQFPYKGRIVNLLDTPGHEDFSEDTYRTLTAVDSALMVIDAAKGVEPRTIKLMEVCRLRDTPIITFVNKLDRDGRPPLALLDEIEKVLGIRCAPITWPLGMGREFRGVYHRLEDRFYLYSGAKDRVSDIESVDGLHAAGLQSRFGAAYGELLGELELLAGAGTDFDLAAFRAGDLTPVFFGSAINNFGVRELLNGFVEWAPGPLPRATETRLVQPHEAQFSGFVFKIQANMDPKHRDRIAFLRVCSGRWRRGMQPYSVRLGAPLRVAGALTFMAAERGSIEDAWPGDIIGLHNHGTIAIGDSFTEGERLAFTGVPNFAPELFRRVVLRDPLKSKQLHKGLDQLCEEGATQVYRPLVGNEVILGAIGPLQFDLVAWRLKDEYGVEASFEPAAVAAARWVTGDAATLAEFRDRNAQRVALDHHRHLVYLANSTVNLQMTEERWPRLRFSVTREQRVAGSD